MKVYGTVNILGDFWPQRTSDIAEVEWSAADEGRILFDADNYDLYYGSSTEWVKISDIDDLFNIQTTLIFASTLPIGWNIQDTNDKVIMLTSNVNKIGNASGSWIITGISKDGKHNHFTPSALGKATPQSDMRVRTGDYYTAHKNHLHTFSNNGNHYHTFDGSWRPSNVKLAIGVYQG